MRTRIYRVEKGDEVETVVGDIDLVSMLGDITLPCKNIHDLIKDGETHLEKDDIKIMILGRYGEEVLNA